MYPTFDSQPFHETYYRLLEAFARGKVRKMMVVMPPQHGKSHGSSVLLPAYMLGLDPNRHIAIASYSAALATRFNRHTQRLIDTPEYGAIFPDTNIKGSGRTSKNTTPNPNPAAANKESASYIRTADHFEVVGAEGELFSVGREGPLTGNRVDTFIIDDLYKDALEANSPVIRENCWDWYLSVVRTRMHNDSSELIVNTRWHQEDLIGLIGAKEPVCRFTDWSQLDNWPPDTWLYFNLEALKVSPACEVDPRESGEALWEERHSAELLEGKRALDPYQFACMYQGAPAAGEGALYSRIETYDKLPKIISRRGNYTDTADMGDDYLCSICYAVAPNGLIYITDSVHSPDPMEITEKLVADMLRDNHIGRAYIESNNGGRGFARAVEQRARGVSVEWFHQSDNKEARILSYSAQVMARIRMPEDWATRWPVLHAHLTSYRRLYRANRWHDAADVLTGIIERETPNRQTRRVRRYK
ncbi:MAG: phage terminase large subunit [Alistipes sp.]|jgi:predicted phage terminase large subunit-like protein|nr:phage terminase large subunit [Alistipes sp.]